MYDYDDYLNIFLIHTIFRKFTGNFGKMAKDVVYSGHRPQNFPSYFFDTIEKTPYCIQKMYA